MTPEEADKAQEWADMDGAIAWHLISRVASWNEIGELMNAWRRAAVRNETRRCINILKEMIDKQSCFDVCLALNNAADDIQSVTIEKLDSSL